MPIGSGAVYAPANIRPATGQGTFAEQIVIINRPALPLQPLGLNTADWTGASRCSSSGTQMMLPMPTNFFVPDSNGADGRTPNHPSGILTADGNSYVESQPLTHCAGNPFTTHYIACSCSIYGDGILGSQGGSHLSGVGGTIRVGEWASARSAGRFPHALKLVLDDVNYSTAVGPGCPYRGCRWPATGSDGGNNPTYSGTNAAVKMGSLIAVARGFNCAGLRTEPGRIYCQTLKDYGAYIVDSGFSTFYIPIEESPDGNAGTEFASLFGFAMVQTSLSNAWALDVRDVMVAAQVITNNDAAHIGGGGAPWVPMAPPIGN